MPVLTPGKTGISGQGFTNGSEQELLMDRGGGLVVIDFYTKAMLDGRGFNVNAGTISVPLVGDVLITDTAAEIAIDAASPYVIIPTAQHISVNLGTGTLHEYATKSVATVSSGGTAFVPLPMLSTGVTNSVAANTSARVDAAGGVTVTADSATTTLLHWAYGNAVAVAAGAAQPTLSWEPLRPPILVGPRCLYVQIAAAGTGPSYYAAVEYLEFTQGMLGL